MKTWAAYALRLPPELKVRLEASAAENGRSLNSEIVQRLRASLAEGYRKL
jgi:predicted HicB family RNase H-like nuclease